MGSSALVLAAKYRKISQPWLFVHLRSMYHDKKPMSPTCNKITGCLKVSFWHFASHQLLARYYLSFYQRYRQPSCDPFHSATRGPFPPGTFEGGSVMAPWRLCSSVVRNMDTLPPLHKANGDPDMFKMSRLRRPVGPPSFFLTLHEVFRSFSFISP